jgi:hypothetical protein
VNTSVLLLGLELQPPTIAAETRVVALEQRFVSSQAYAPAAGRLAAAMATIWASRRPIRDGAPRSNERICCISHLPSAPVEQSLQQGRTTEHGLARLTSRDAYENSNARVVRTPAGSGFIAAIKPATEQIFSPISRPIIR